MRRFVDEYLIDPNATAAYKKVYRCSQKVAQASGARLLANVRVKAEIDAAQARRAAKVGITQEMVIERLWDIATADPNELIEFRRTCCRYCYGENHEYQHTAREMERRQAEWDARARKKPNDVFDEQGGIGYNRTQPPNPACSECFGEGEGTTFVKDTRNLSPAASRLYAGIKQTKEGIEIKVHDQAAALINIGKHLGLFIEKPEPPEAEGERAQKIKRDLDEMDRLTIGKAA